MDRQHHRRSLGLSLELVVFRYADVVIYYIQVHRILRLDIYVCRATFICI